MANNKGVLSHLNLLFLWLGNPGPAEDVHQACGTSRKMANNKGRLIQINLLFLRRRNPGPRKMFPKVAGKAGKMANKGPLSHLNLLFLRTLGPEEDVPKLAEHTGRWPIIKGPWSTETYFSCGEGIQGPRKMFPKLAEHTRGAPPMSTWKSL